MTRLFGTTHLGPSTLLEDEFEPLPPLTPWAKRVYDELREPDNLPDKRRLPEVNGDLSKVCDAFGAPYEKGAWVRGLGTELEPFRQAMNVSTAPIWLLPYLAQFVGVQIPKGTSEADARAMIMDRTHQLRGKPQTIIDVTKTFLTGDKAVFLQEQSDGNPFFFRLYIRSSEAPGDLTALKQAIAAVKPGAFTFEIVLSDAITWNASLSTWDLAQGPWDHPGSPPNP